MESKDSCPFCLIATGGPAHIIWEDESHLAFLSRNPSTEGATMVIPKSHAGGYAFALEDASLAEFIAAVKQVAGLLDHAYTDKRTMMVLRGLTVDHVHAKLYPVTADDKRPHGSGQRAPAAPDAELALVAERLRSLPLPASQ